MRQAVGLRPGIRDAESGSGRLRGRHGDETDEATLLEFCRERLSGWQVPKRIFLLEALPANERGKISRRELAKQFAR